MQPGLRRFRICIAILMRMVGGTHSNRLKVFAPRWVWIRSSRSRRCQGAGAGGRLWPARLPLALICCCWMNRPIIWILRRSAGWRAVSRPFLGRCCLSHTIGHFSSALPPGSLKLIAANCAVGRGIMLTFCAVGPRAWRQSVRRTRSSTASWPKKRSGSARESKRGAQEMREGSGRLRQCVKYAHSG